MNQTPDQLHADLMADTVAFPVLSVGELEECAEFGTRCSFGAGEDLFGAGAHPFDCHVILSGEVCITDVSTDEPTYLIRLRGVIGGGNSAGQAAMFLTQYARKVMLVVRGSDFRKSMSSYLCDRVAADPEIEVRYHTQVGPSRELNTSEPFTCGTTFETLTARR